MKKIVGLVLAGMGTCIVGAAQADIFAGGPVYAGNPSISGSITCRVFNAGTTPVNITKRQIFDNIGNVVTAVTDVCNTPLNPKQTCFYSAPTGGNLAYSCRLVTSGTDDNLRGTVEMFASPTQFFELPLTK